MEISSSLLPVSNPLNNSNKTYKRVNDRVRELGGVGAGGAGGAGRTDGGSEGGRKKKGKMTKKLKEKFSDN